MSDTPYTELPSGAQASDQPSSFWRLSSWCITGAIYAASATLNFFSQTASSWGKYAFELTQVGAWLTIAQHLIHPDSPVRPYLLNAFDICSTNWQGRWKCIKDDSYTHGEGLSNLALAAEMVIPSLYWSLAYPFIKLSSSKEYVNAIFMHGVISLGLLADYLINNRPFHFRHTLVNLSALLVCYVGWNYVGQKIKSEPVYPMVDFEKDPINTSIALAAAIGVGLIGSAGVKGLLHARQKTCPSRRNSLVFHDLEAGQDTATRLLADRPEQQSSTTP